jgi:DNA primase
VIPNKTVEEILSTARVEDVIEDFVTLKRRGVNMMGLCPFHDEKTPSFVVSPAKGLFKCFGCGKSGTAVGFIMEHENLTYPEALKYLANRYNIVIEEIEISDTERASKQLSDSLYIINEFAAKYFNENLSQTEEGRAIGLSYFKERGFLDKTINHWQLGYAMKEGRSLTQTAISKQFNVENLKVLGLTTQNDNDFFRERVIFPIHNLSGKIIAFAGRILTNIKTQPKYLNSPESEIYNKRKNLFGLYFAKNEIRKTDECILVEGYTDVMTLHQGGVENVVASSGTSLTEEQIRLINRFTKNITIIYDGDSAGIKAALRGLDLVLKEDMNVRLVLLPDGDDPDSFFKKNGTEKFKQYIEVNKKDFIAFKTDLLLEENGNDPIKRAEILRDLANTVALIPDAIKRLTYVRELSTKLEIDEKVLSGEIEKEVNKHKRDRAQQIQREKIRESRLSGESDVTIERGEDTISIKPVEVNPDIYQERNLIRLLVTGGDTALEDQKELTVGAYLLPILKDYLEYFEDPISKKIVEFGIQQLEKNKKIEPKDFLYNADQEISKMSVDYTMSKYEYAKWEERGVYLQTQPMPEKNFKKDTYQSILRFKLHKVKKDIKEIETLIKLPDITEEQKLIDIQVLQALLKERNDIAKELTQIIY